MGSTLTILVLVVLLALIFDYINGFHDTANAVATVVSTNVLPGRTAVLLAAACYPFLQAHIFPPEGVVAMLGIAAGCALLAAARPAEELVHGT